MNAGGLRRRLRLARLALHLLQGLLTCALVFPLAGQAQRRRLIQRWSARLVAICGLAVSLPATAHAGEKALIVSNHVSWLDIFVINARVPCRFVAKSDIRGWPVLGWLCARAGTIFIARGRVRDVRRIFQDLVHSLHAGDHVAFFPEGTTSPPGGLLPFHANLFEAAIDAGVPVHPYALRYLDGEGNYHPAVDFSGDTGFMESLMRVLEAPGIRVELVDLPPLDTRGAHRRELAEAAHREVASALGLQPRQARAG
ncbi:lyso-ornithine lipid acyltransferase [Noviherbaspirillum humi]|uniref:Lyso-ornithine lipid acyltransferase n=1 Tax=Noviherbaspirillum humi TaxID=1688639 RepID=A0A239CTF9_9BURK|nr:lysophospholipid acyltransferase family protein [Noviherbaspirillum humi]SNS23367.1 lyso-ornithine lipid acyltransferase [Noviherbaspirillum humi]